VSYSLLATLRRIVQEELRALRTAELAVVQDIHPHASASDDDNYAVTVALRESGIVLKQVPVACARAGFATIPAVGQLVLVQFVGGDLNAPIVTGSLYNDVDRPPENDDGQLVLHLPQGAGASDAVHVAVTSASERKIELALGSTLAITLADDDPVVQIDVGGGKAKVQIDRDGAVMLSSQGDLKLAGNGVSVKAQGKLELEGATVKVKGSVINLN
jgi:phage baseplate assembly protein gpV